MKYDEYFDFLSKLSLTEDQSIQIMLAINGFIEREHDLMVKAKDNPELIEEYNFRRGKCNGLGLVWKLIAGTLAYTDEIDCSWPHPDEDPEPGKPVIAG